MFWNCVSKQNYTNLHKDEKCEEDNCEECLVKELLKENWQRNPENVILEIAYEKKIIKNIVTSIRELNPNDTDVFFDACVPGGGPVGPELENRFLH